MALGATAITRHKDRSDVDIYIYCTGDCQVVDICTDWTIRNLGFYNLQRPESKERMSSRETERTEDIALGDRRNCARSTS